MSAMGSHLGSDLWSSHPIELIRTPPVVPPSTWLRGFYYMAVVVKTVMGSLSWVGECTHSRTISVVGLVDVHWGLTDLDFHIPASAPGEPGRKPCGCSPSSRESDDRCWANPWCLGLPTAFGPILLVRCPWGDVLRGECSNVAM